MKLTASVARVNLGVMKAQSRAADSSCGLLRCGMCTGLAAVAGMGQILVLCLLHPGSAQAVLPWSTPAFRVKGSTRALPHSSLCSPGEGLSPTLELWWHQVRLQISLQSKVFQMSEVGCFPGHGDQLSLMDFSSTHIPACLNRLMHPLPLFSLRQFSKERIAAPAGTPCTLPLLRSWAPCP